MAGLDEPGYRRTDTVVSLDTFTRKLAGKVADRVRENGVLDRTSRRARGNRVRVVWV